MLRREVHRVAVVARRVVRLRLGVGLSPSAAAPLAAGLGALRPLRPRPPVAVDRARLLVARVNLHIKVAMSYYFQAPNVDKTYLISTVNGSIPGLEKSFKCKAAREQQLAFTDQTDQPLNLVLS